MNWGLLICCCEFFLVNVYVCVCVCVCVCSLVFAYFRIYFPFGFYQFAKRFDL